jgi:hypothetical protein
VKRVSIGFGPKPYSNRNPNLTGGESFADDCLNLFRLDAEKVERNYGSKIQRSSKLSKRKLNLLSENFKDFITVA